MKPPFSPAPLGSTASPLTGPRLTLDPGVEGEGWRRVRFGLCEDYPRHTVSLRQAEEDLRYLAQRGTRALRISVAWGDVEPQRGKLDWTHLDRFIALAESSGVAVLPYIAYAPKWATDPDGGEGGHGNEYWKHPPIDVNDFARFVYACAVRYAGRVASWEIWNEPDNKEFFAGKPEDYALMLRAGSAAVRAADRKAKVVFGGIAWSAWYVNELFAKHGAGELCDVVNIHNYDETWIDQPVEAITSYVGRIADTIARYGQGQEIWMAEVGYSTHRGGASGADVSSTCAAYFGYEHTDRYAAAHLTKTMALLLATERLSTIAWYELRDLPTDALRIGDANNNRLGLCTAALQPKPAMRAWCFLQRLLGGTHRCIDDSLHLTRRADSDAHVHAFELPDGRVIAFAWLQTLVPGARSARTWGDVADDRREIVELSIPGFSTGLATTFDPEGVQRDRRDVPYSDTGARLRLALCGGDVTILELTPSRQSTPDARHAAA